MLFASLLDSLADGSSLLLVAAAFAALFALVELLDRL
jgi:hypothetical protein